MQCMYFHGQRAVVADRISLHNQRKINNSIQNSTCCRPKPDEVDFFTKTFKPLKEIMHEILSWSGRFFEVLLFVELVAVIIRVYD